MSDTEADSLKMRVRFLEASHGVVWNENLKRYENMGFVPCPVLDCFADETTPVEELQPDGTLLSRPLSRFAR